MMMLTSKLSIKSSNLRSYLFLRHHESLDRYLIYLSQMTTIMFQLSKPQWGFFSSNVIYQIRLIAGFFYYLSNTTDVTEGLPRLSKIILCFQWCLCSRVFLFLCCVFKTVCLLVVFCFVWALSVCLRLMNLTVLLGFSVFF